MSPPPPHPCTRPKAYPKSLPYLSRASSPNLFIRHLKAPTAISQDRNRTARLLARQRGQVRQRKLQAQPLLSRNLRLSRDASIPELLQMVALQHLCQDISLHHNNRCLRSSRPPRHKIRDRSNHQSAPLHAKFRLLLNNSQLVLAAIPSPSKLLQTSNASLLLPDRTVMFRLLNPLLSSLPNHSMIW